MEAFDKAAAAAPASTKRYVKRSFDIADRIHAILQAQGKSQKDLAQLLGKRESEISKWMTGQHNLTIKTIAAIEAALDENVIEVPSFTTKGAAPYVLEDHGHQNIAADSGAEYHAPKKKIGKKADA